MASCPSGQGVAAGATDLAPGVTDIVGDFEGRVGPAENLAGQGNFIAAQWCSVGSGGAALVRCALADGGLASDQRRLGAILGPLDGAPDGGGIMAVDGFNVPAKRFEAGQLVV